MINAFQIARPYAKAAFEYAKEHRRLAEWSENLRVMAERVSNPEVQAFMQNPNVEEKDRVAVCKALGKDQLDKAGQNFMHMLVEKRRILVLPEVFKLYETFRLEAEKTRTVQVTSAIPLTETYKHKLIKLLQGKYNTEIDLQCEVDPKLVGGLMIVAGDQVIDGTVKGQLQRLKDAVLC